MKNSTGHYRADHDQYQIKPVIEKVYPFEEAIQAYEHLSKGAFGKIVIKI